MSMRPSTDFQQRMTAAVEALATEVGILTKLQHVEGETESYCILELLRTTPSIKVYVYTQEAGFFEGNDWHIYERCDFDSPEELVRTLVSDMRSRLVSDASPPPTQR